MKGLDYKELLQEMLTNEKYRELYNTSPVFNKALMSIVHGANEKEIIYHLCKTIEEQQDILKSIIMNNPSINW